MTFLLPPGIKGLIINSVTMTLALIKEKVLNFQNRYTPHLAMPDTTIIELTKFLGKLSFTIQAVLPGKIRGRYLQKQQIQAMKKQIYIRP